VHLYCGFGTDILVPRYNSSHVETPHDPQGRAPEPASKRHSRLILGTVATIVIAGATAFATGLGSNLADDVSAPSKPLLSWSAMEETAGCGWNSEVYLPRTAAARGSKLKPEPEDLQVFQRAPEAAMAGTQRVNVSIQGESERPVTLLGINFHVHRSPQPPGAIFVSPCGGPTVGRTIVFSLDSDPPRITESNDSSNRPLGEIEGAGTSLNHPIRFPWTVSLTDPLLLILLAKLEGSCLCTWTAEIPWVSGKEQGIISIDNGGDGYRMVSSHGLDFYTPGTDGKWTVNPAQ
jgi:hypothetical protein